VLEINKDERLSVAAERCHKMRLCRDIFTTFTHTHVTKKTHNV